MYSSDELFQRPQEGYLVFISQVSIYTYITGQVFWFIDEVYG